MDSDPGLFTDEWWALVGWFMDECKKRGIAVALSDYTISSPGQGWYMDAILEKHPEIVGKKLVYEDGEVKIKTIPGSVDPMNPHLGEYVIEEFYGKFEEHFPGEGGKGLDFFFSDELVFNIRGNLWNDSFAEEFERRKGYSIEPHLLAIFEDVGGETQKIRLDRVALQVDEIAAVVAEDRGEPLARVRMPRDGGDKVVLKRLVDDCSGNPAAKGQIVCSVHKSTPFHSITFAGLPQGAGQRKDAPCGAPSNRRQ